MLHTPRFPKEAGLITLWGRFPVSVAFIGLHGPMAVAPSLSDLQQATTACQGSNGLRVSALHTDADACRDRLQRKVLLLKPRTSSNARSTLEKDRAVRERRQTQLAATVEWRCDYRLLKHAAQLN